MLDIGIGAADRVLIESDRDQAAGLSLDNAIAAHRDALSRIATERA
jgi:hypothetical protein